jgi:S1-C subfamily serine protease
MQGDVIKAFNDAMVKTPRDLAVAVANAHTGSKAKLTVWRRRRGRRRRQAG